MSYKRAQSFESEADRLGVSEVARSEDGFMREYEQAKTASAMKKRSLPTGVRGGETWDQKRNGFLARFVPDPPSEITYARFLALVMWAYHPPVASIPPKGAPRSAMVKITKH